MGLKIFFFLFIVVFYQMNCVTGATGSGYTVNHKVPVYDTPSYNGKVYFSIESGAPYEILSSNIKDTDSGVGFLWYKVHQHGKFGYVSTAEEVDKKNIIVFLKVKENKYGLVIGTQLILRDYPGQNGKVLDKLPAREILEILEEQIREVDVAGTKGTWAKVKTKSQKIGYVFTGFVLRGRNQEELLKINDIELPQSGWAIVLKRPKNIFSYNEGKLIPNGKFGESLYPGEEVYFKSKLITKDGKVYYLVHGETEPPVYHVDSDHEMPTSKEPTMVYSGYMEAELLRTFSTNARLYISKYSGPLKKDFLEFIDISMDGKVDLEKIEIQEQKISKKSFYLVKAKEKSIYLGPTVITSGFREYLPEQIYTLLFKKEENGYKFYFRSMAKVSFLDLEGNGDYKLFSESKSQLPHKEEVLQELYYLDRDNLMELALFSGIEKSCGHITFDGPFLIRNKESCNSEQKNKYSPYKFKVEKNKLIPSP